MGVGVVIAKLVTEGRYSAPYTPDGVYADLRIMVANRKRLIREMTQIKNRFARWFAIYFPEYTDVFGDYEAQSSMLLLKKVCTPEAIVELGAEKINQIWRDAYEYNFSDKELHFLVIGILGMMFIFVVYPVFKWLAKHDHVMVIAWIYVFTLIIVITFAIEIGQKVTNTGNMEFACVNPSFSYRSGRGYSI